MGNTLRSKGKIRPREQLRPPPPPAVLHRPDEHNPILVLGSGEAGSPIFSGSSFFVAGQMEPLILQTPRRLLRLRKYLMDMHGIIFSVYDARGLYLGRNEWDWINYIPVIPECILYISDLSMYNQFNTESRRNEMRESISNFRSLCRRLQDISLIVIFANQDEFREKLKLCNIADQQAFADFEGEPRNFYDALHYFRSKFEVCFQEKPTSHLYIHLEDPRSIEYNRDQFMDAIQRILLNNNLLISGFLSDGFHETRGLAVVEGR